MTSVDDLLSRCEAVIEAATVVRDAAEHGAPAHEIENGAGVVLIEARWLAQAAERLAARENEEGGS